MAEIKNIVDEAIRLITDNGMGVNKAARKVLDAHGIPQGSNFNSIRVNISKKIKQLRDAGKISATETKEKKAKVEEPLPFVCSAWNFEKGYMMGIDEYCEKYNLPIDNVVSYKLVTHTGTPFYNTLFKDVFMQSELISDDTIDRMITKYIHPVALEPNKFLAASRKFQGMDKGWFDRVIYTDTHIGMDTDKDGQAMYATPWNRAEQMRRADILVSEVINNKVGSSLYIDELGDFMDGYNGFTTRGGHALPQNMSNEEAFDTGMEFKMHLIDQLMPYYDCIYVNNICNDNHAGSFGYLVNSAVKRICFEKYPGRVFITNHQQFINHYTVGKHAFVISHGKDSKALKFGFKPKLDAVQIEKIDAYLKFNKLYAIADFIEFAKGDSHQMLLDYCTSDDFDYFNYPAFAPASEWVQTNFKKSRSGFVIQNVKYNERVKNVIPVFFN